MVKYVNLKFYHIQVKQRTPVYKSYELIFFTTIPHLINEVFLLERCTAKPASVHIPDVGVVEDIPELLETYVRVMNPLDPTSIVVSLMPQQLRTQYPASIANNVADATHKTAKVFDKYYREKHLPHVQDGVKSSYTSSSSGQ